MSAIGRCLACQVNTVFSWPMENALRRTASAWPRYHPSGVCVSQSANCLTSDVVNRFSTRHVECSLSGRPCGLLVAVLRLGHPLHGLHA